jgi:hypothetical protein
MNTFSKFFLGFALVAFLVTPAASFAKSDTANMSGTADTSSESKIERSLAMTETVVSSPVVQTTSSGGSKRAQKKSNGPAYIITAPTITVVSPNGGEAWTKGHSHTIEWNSANVATVSILLTNPTGFLVGSVAPSMTNTGSYNWTIPTGISTGYYKVMVLGGGGGDSSDAPFFIFSASDADFNHDGTVDGADLGIALAYWGPATANVIQDINKDGMVDGADLDILFSVWGIVS